MEESKDLFHIDEKMNDLFSDSIDKTELLKKSKELELTKEELYMLFFINSLNDEK